MSVLADIRDKVRGKPGPAPITLEVVVSQLAETEADIADLNSRIATATVNLNTLRVVRDEAAILSVKGDGEADLRYARAMKGIEEQETLLVKLNAALRFASDKSSKLANEKAKAASEAQIKAVERLARKRHERATALEATIKQYVKDWKSLLDANLNISLAYPGGSAAIHAGSMIEPAKIVAAVERVLYKYGAVLPTGGPPGQRSIPGARGDVANQWQPHALPSLVEQIEDGNRVLMSSITGTPIISEAFAAQPAETASVAELPKSPAVETPKTRTVAEIQATIPKQRLTVEG